ncbi:MAG: adhesin [Gammaproteobacteria bacterium]|nr:adhesin [Gammaproteobacteria bacterium]
MLPNTELAVIVEEKVRDYLLSDTHPLGRFKAAIFRGLGYRQSEWSRLSADLKGFLSKEANPQESTKYGQKYEIRGRLTGPNGKSVYLVTAWIVLRGEDFPRFITAYPGERK